MLYQALSQSCRLLCCCPRVVGLETATGWRNVLLDGVLIAQVLMPGPAGPKPRPRINYARFHTIIPPPLTVELKVQNRIANLVYDRVPGFDSGQVRFFSQESCRLLVLFRVFIKSGAVITFKSSLATPLKNHVFKKF